MSALSSKNLTLIIGNDVLTVDRVLSREQQGHPLHLKGIVGTVEDKHIETMVRELLQKHGAENRVRYMTAVCDPERLRKEKAPYRDDFSRRLAESVSDIGSDITVFAHMMYVVTAEYSQRHGSSSMNTHPSVLPADRGGHPEYRALKAGRLRDLGYTYHTINAVQAAGDPGRLVDLDNGTVILQQIVEPPEQFDPVLAENFGKPYEHHLEERTRLTVMSAASNTVSDVALLLANATPQSMCVVRDEEAFRHEGPSRLGFYHSARFQELLRLDYDGFLKSRKKSAEEYSYQQWLREEYPGYSRALFLDSSGKFRTAENILGISPEAKGIEVQPLTKYDFVIRGKSLEEAQRIFQGLCAMAKGPQGDQLHNQKGGTSDHWAPGLKMLKGTIVTTRPMSSILSTTCVGFEAKTFQVRVGAEKNGNFQELQAGVEEDILRGLSSSPS